jgi:GntR family transcriptional regulator/MocR family aminotransferase
VLQARKAHLIPVPVGGQGVRVDDLAAYSESQLAYLTPTNQYPLGCIMPANQQTNLLKRASCRGTWLLQDDYDSEFHCRGKPVAALLPEIAPYGISGAA